MAVIHFMEKRCFEHTQKAEPDHPVHAQSIIRAFALLLYILQFSAILLTDSKGPGRTVRMPEDTLSHGTIHMIDDFSSAGQCPLNSSTLWAKSAGDKLMTFFFFFNFPWKEKRVWQFIQTGDDLYEMSNLYLFIFLGKNATCISKCRLLKVLPTMLRCNSSIKYARGR